MLHYCLTNNKDHLLSILALSAKNLKENMLASDFSKEGFVTAEYDFNFLEKMAAVHPSVVATNKNSGIVEAYALIMDKQFDSGIPVLAPFFDEINNIIYQGHFMKDLSYIILGQICVAKDFRGQGVFRKLYDVFNQYASKEFDYIITEIDATNERSMDAHLTYGFEQIHQYLSKDGRKWAVVLYKL